MVVAEFHRERWISSLCAGVFRLLLRHQTGDYRTGTNSHVFRLHRADGPHILVIDWYDRFLCRVRFHQKNIRGCQDRLVKIITNRVMRVNKFRFLI